MGNCISKINKDLFFAIKEFMKNDILFSNGIKRLSLDMTTRGTDRGGGGVGGTSIIKPPGIMKLAPLQTGVVVERTLKKWVRCMK